MNSPSNASRRSIAWFKFSKGVGVLWLETFEGSCSFIPNYLEEFGARFFDNRLHLLLVLISVLSSRTSGRFFPVPGGWWTRAMFGFFAVSRGLQVQSSR